MNRRLRLFAEIIAVLAILLSSCVKDSQPGKDDNTEVGPGGDDNGGDNGGDDNGGGDNGDNTGGDNGDNGDGDNTGGDNGDGGNTGGDNGDGGNTGGDNPVPGTANWLEMTSTLPGDRYVVNTTYAGKERNYTHFYDKTMMTSLWTAYPLNSSHMGDFTRPKKWSYNPAISSEYQMNVTSGSFSGYSRGHMCPNGSRNGNKTMQNQTFYVTNQVPQIQNEFNGSIWNALENAVQAIGGREEIYIVTGVTFNKGNENKEIKYTKPNDDASQDCPIPNYFYKVVLRVKHSGNTVTDARAIGFWFEHKKYGTKAKDFENYTETVDKIEEWTGFDFFINLPDKLEAAAESASPNWSEFTNW